MKRAEMRLYGPVGEGIFDDGDAITAKGVAEELDRHKAAGVKALDVYLSSDGGLVGEGLAVYAQLARYPGDVTVHVDGRALSIASVIALAGKRCVMPASAMLMIHAPFAPVVGNPIALRKAADALDVMGRTMRDIYCAASGLPPEKVQAIMDAETWLDAKAAVDLGFADAIEEPAGARAETSTPSLLATYQNTPEGLRSLSAAAALSKLEAALARQQIQQHTRGASVTGAGLNGPRNHQAVKEK